MAVRTTTTKLTEEPDVEPVDEPKAATSDDSVLHAIASAMKDAAETASTHAANVKQTMTEAGPTALASMSRAAYTCAYVAAYGAVYAAVFVAQSMPQENPIAHGLRDGGQAAMDALDTRSVSGGEDHSHGGKAAAAKAPAAGLRRAGGH